MPKNVDVWLIISLTANIHAESSLTVTNNGQGSTSPSGTFSIGYGASTAISAIPETGYHFVNWTKTPLTGAIVFGNATGSDDSP